MVDPIGTVLSLAGLFTSCLQVWDFVDAGRTHASNFSLLRTKLDNQRILFVIWGKKLGFGTNEYDSRLDDPFIAPTIEANLNHIQQIFTDTESLVDRYGIRIMERGGRRHRTDPAIFRNSYKAFLGQLQQNQRNMSIWKVTRWSIKDERKFETMVTNLADLVQSLDRITEAFISQAKAEELASEAMNDIDDMESVVEVRQAAGSAESVLSNAASIRLARADLRTVRLRLPGPWRDVAETLPEEQNRTPSQSSGAERILRPGTVSMQIRAPELPRDLTERESETASRETETTSTAKSSPNEIAEVSTGQSDLSPGQEPLVSEIVPARPITSTTSPIRDDAQQRGESSSESSTPEGPPEPASISTTLQTAVPGDVVPSAQQIWDQLVSANKAKIQECLDGNAFFQRRAKWLQAHLEDRFSCHNFITWAPKSPEDAWSLLAAIKGPPGTPYEGGIFYLDVALFPSDRWKVYRFSFRTRIYHPNIDARGTVCQNWLHDNWCLWYQVDHALLLVVSLLDDWRMECESNSHVAEVLRQSKNRFDCTARIWTQRYATGKL